MFEWQPGVEIVLDDDEILGHDDSVQNNNIVEDNVDDSIDDTLDKLHEVDDAAIDDDNEDNDNDDEHKIEILNDEDVVNNDDNPVNDANQGVLELNDANQGVEEEES